MEYSPIWIVCNWFPYLRCHEESFTSKDNLVGPRWYCQRYPNAIWYLSQSPLCLRISFLGSFSLHPPVEVAFIVYSLPTSSFSLRPPREGSANWFSVDFVVRCFRLVFSISFQLYSLCSYSVYWSSKFVCTMWASVFVTYLFIWLVFVSLFALSSRFMYFLLGTLLISARWFTFIPPSVPSICIQHGLSC